MTSRLIRELHNDVDDPEFQDRRKMNRRQLQGRREADVAAQRESGCVLHDLEMKLRDDRCEERKEQNDAAWTRQIKVNESIDAKIDSVNNKLNYVLGACFVLWPLMQLLLQYLIRSK